MDHGLLRLNRNIKAYDRDLYAVKGANGVVQIMRKTNNTDAFLYGDSIIARDQLVFALTDSWKLSGRPVEWGIDPILRKLSEMDAWSKERIYEDLVRTRERNEELRRRRNQNELRALAADCRKEFAKATNDINTSTL